METFELQQTVDAPIGDVRAAMLDLEPFMLASGFDEIEIDGDVLEISKALGLLKISLTLRRLDDPESVLAFEQVDGIFESMTTSYSLADRDGQTVVTARTEFALDAPGGSILDGTVVKRQRRKEITGQFEYLRRAVS
ncbi:SRPBCC family protein [Halapricum desulfuricans]|uniref:START/RHO_alpha_C/PITP/Bet_v1/CoxG/CalC (SRPBCC)ligand-binding domain superfamily protein n=1 Tax=Halapricum desulfuricans TaxID=2841257 RepID=A0A897NI72_9EURY|nr:SRPBCC family protein [Halapricum desulfuricans]QSG14130.1 START/RHO_alpha_C/PITP/Bet_v1/CoxG/CalC (SRPBCC)ligand-binding domain superfamily protein [Halapricum desulfuricans]